MATHTRVLLFLFVTTSLFAKTEKFTHNQYATPKASISKRDMRDALVAESHQQFLIEINEYFEEWLESDSSYRECSEELQSFILSEINKHVKQNIKTKIVRESWIEKSYYLKTRVSFDPIYILRMVNNSLELKESHNELQRLQDAIMTKQLDVKVVENELNDLNLKVAEIKDSLILRKSQLKQSRDSLRALQYEQKDLRAEYKTIISQQEDMRLVVDSFYNAQNQISQMVAASVRVGMTESETHAILKKNYEKHILAKDEHLLGWNRRKVKIANTFVCRKLGNTWLIFYDDELMSIVNDSNFEYARSHYKRDVQTAFSYFIRNDISIKSENN